MKIKENGASYAPYKLDELNMQIANVLHSELAQKCRVDTVHHIIDDLKDFFGGQCPPYTKPNLTI
ncbi:MAG: hypothetical protein Q4B82_03465 [Alysiella sp.]|uniref:hypothetical protein n=1 Tax=Alysiella sp. TaxID=1872483 RepID=UPI0026DC906C|nr:hypothetical protein [Alysiella sp.]MDO4433621.1 hypothetical protein [Alysiella sp.]